MTGCVERWGNPFLLREWRRACRRGQGPLVGPLFLAGLSIGLFLFTFVVCQVLLLPSVRTALAELEIPVSSSLLGSVSRWTGQVVVGIMGWGMLLACSWLARGQTWMEEKQRTLELVFATPLTRARIATLLTAWPLLYVALCAVPMLPLLVLLMPILGLSAAGAGRAVLVILTLCLVIAPQAPSGEEAAGRSPARRVAPVIGGLVVAVFAGPSLCGLLSWLFGLTGISILTWPLGLGELLAAHREFFAGHTWVGPWLMAVLLLGAAARWLASWERLCEGSEERAVPPSAVSTPLVLLLVFLLTGLWWGCNVLPDRALRIWYGLHFVFMLVLFRNLRTTREPAWHWLWWAGRRWPGPLAQAGLRLLDATLFALGAPLLWAAGAVGLGGAPPSPGPWSATATLLATAWISAGLYLGLSRERRRLKERGEEGRAKQTSATGALTVLGLLWLVWLVVRISHASSMAGPFFALFFGWHPLCIAGAALFGLLTAVAVGLAELRPAPAARPVRSAVERASVFWALLPRRWRDNPLAVKAHRVMRRRGLTGLLAAVMIGVAACGLVPLVLSWTCGKVPFPTTLGWLPITLYLSAGWLQDMGAGMANGLFGVADLTPGPAAVLSEVALLGGVAAVVLLSWTATLAGKMVTEERLAGSLGFLLLSDMSDREVADGFVIGHVYPALEMLSLILAALAIWAVASLHWTVMAVAAMAGLYLLGLVVATASLAFLGTARYESRANGTNMAVGGVLGLQAAGLFVVLMAGAVASEFRSAAVFRHTALLGTCAWVVMTLVCAAGLWASGPGSIRSLRRVGRLWRAFEPASPRD
ncbi:MAG: hypothetical protein HYU66_11445 [Armatimonadetes bacterium]|nr:hypothetical protein [Armatimonadota bacterium]